MKVEPRIRVKAQPSMLASKGLLQRKCACGGSPGTGGECADCQKKKLDLQRHKEAGAGGPTIAPPIVHEVLSSPGRPLDTKARSLMESRLGHDFGRVRVHSDGQAAESARSVGALAYTVGQHVVFGAGQYVPESAEGQRLLAHELAHTVQQRGEASVLQSDLVVGRGGDRWEQEAEAAARGESVSLTPVALLLQRQDDTVDVELEPTSPEDAARLRREGVNLPQVSQSTYSASGGQTFHPRTRTWSPCARLSTQRVSGYRGNTHGTYVSAISVAINPAGTSQVSLSWANPGLSTESLQTSLTCSPGAGNCNRDCSVLGDSTATGSHCTPLGSFTVQGYDCQLPGDAAAKFVTWFHRDRGIAFHYYNVPPYPASHGCVRMVQSENGAELIYDNVLAGVTQVTVTRDPAAGPGPMCYRSGRLVARPAPRTGGR